MSRLIIQAAVLGIVQGLTEFIPVSSSGHLVIIPRIFGWKDLGLAFDVAIHLGTLVALIIYFRREWVLVLKGFFTSLGRRPSTWDFDQRLAWMLLLASVPVAAVGAALSGFAEGRLRTLSWVSGFLIFGAVVMLAAEIAGRKARGFEELRPVDAASMGLAQVLALAPGLTRSGVTISAGMARGLDRRSAARFAFMMAAPVIAGAGLWEGIKIAREGTGGVSATAFAVGFVASAVTGFLAVKYLLAYLKSRTLAPFIVYGAALGTGVLVYIAVT